MLDAWCLWLMLDAWCLMLDVMGPDFSYGGILTSIFHLPVPTVRGFLQVLHLLRTTTTAPCLSSASQKPDCHVSIIPVTLQGTTSTWHPSIWHEHFLISHPCLFFWSFLSLANNLVPMLTLQGAIPHVLPVPFAFCITQCIKTLISCGDADISSQKLTKFACK